ncbi:hypothetical protein CSUI_008104 [Cystoisospora suis]|uniref:Homologous recombination OB-fold protein OB-fold domain-containing protein n=1 Tax=Cystoisospora suis TaxID=483139 RepID=A0A2C6JQQ2_9APIC|nr:hypothetical protein CSUI_008104 [Cystoisospora suis]
MDGDFYLEEEEEEEDLSSSSSSSFFSSYHASSWRYEDSEEGEKELLSSSSSSSSSQSRHPHPSNAVHTPEPLTHSEETKNRPICSQIFFKHNEDDRAIPILDQRQTNDNFSAQNLSRKRNKSQDLSSSKHTLGNQSGDGRLRHVNGALLRKEEDSFQSKQNEASSSSFSFSSSFSSLRALKSSLREIDSCRREGGGYLGLPRNDEAHVLGDKNSPNRGYISPSCPARSLPEREERSIFTEDNRMKKEDILHTHLHHTTSYTPRDQSRPLRFSSSSFSSSLSSSFYSSSTSGASRWKSLGKASSFSSSSSSSSSSLLGGREREKLDTDLSSRLTHAKEEERSETGERRKRDVSCREDEEDEHGGQEEKQDEEEDSREAKESHANDKCMTEKERSKGFLPGPAGILMRRLQQLHQIKRLKEEKDGEIIAPTGGFLSTYTGSPLRKMLSLASSGNVFLSQGEKHSPLIIEIEDGGSEEEEDHEEVKNRHLFSRSVSWTHALLVAALPLDDFHLGLTPCPPSSLKKRSFLCRNNISSILNRLDSASYLVDYMLVYVKNSSIDLNCWDLEEEEEEEEEGFGEALEDGLLTVMDPTGEMPALVHGLAIEAHGDDLVPGSALLLKDVAVILAEFRLPYLVLTLDNIVRAFPPVPWTPSVQKDLDMIRAEGQLCGEAFPGDVLSELRESALEVDGERGGLVLAGAPADALGSVCVSPIPASTGLATDIRVKAEENTGKFSERECIARKEHDPKTSQEAHDDTSWLSHLDDLDDVQPVKQQSSAPGEQGGDTRAHSALDGFLSSSISDKQVTLLATGAERVRRVSLDEENSTSSYAEQTTSCAAALPRLDSHVDQQNPQGEVPPKSAQGACVSSRMNTTVDTQPVRASEASDVSGSRDHYRAPPAQFSEAKLSQEANSVGQYDVCSGREDSQSESARDFERAGDLLPLYGETNDQLNELLDVLLDDADI